MLVKRILAAAAAAALVLSMTACASSQPQVQQGASSQAAFSGSAAVTSNRYTQVADTTGPSMLEGMTLEGYEKIAESDHLELYLRKESASLRVVNKENGYVWGALRQDKPENLNKTWSSFGNSIVSIKYFDETGNIIQMGAGHEDNTCTYDMTENGVVCHVTFKKAKISLSAKVELVDDHIRFSVDDSSIEEKGDFALGQLYFAPFLGSTVGDEISGYMFIPDGSGALIRFQKPTKYLAGYSERVYGSDYAIDNLFVVGDLQANRTNDFLKDSESVSMPVYGISHGYQSNALLGYVENGGEYAAIMAEPAGIVTDYNYSTAYFIYRQVYQQPTGRDGSGIQMVQSEMNTVEPALSVYFLAGDDADYSGMAHTYRDILLEKGWLPQGEVSEGALALDYLVADVQKGFLLNSTANLTTAQDVLDAAAYLKSQGVGNVQFGLLGWQNGGLNGYNKLSVCGSSQLGSFFQLVSLQESLEADGYGLSMYLSPMTLKEGQENLQSDFGITLSQSVISIQRDNENVFLPDTMFLKTGTALQVLREQVGMLSDAGLGNVMIDQAGGMLYGEYLRNEEVSRSQTMENVVEALTDLAGEKGLSLYDPNEYAFAATSVYRDVPMVSSRYTFESDTVPFLQLVLSGSMSMYAPYANQSFYTDIDVLKCIEFNAYPSFLLTGAPSSALADTPSEEYFSTCFEDWKDTAVSVYQRIDSVLSHVRGQQMLHHSAIASGVMKITYSGGGSVYVNYTNETVLADGVTLAALSAVYVGA